MSFSSFFLVFLAVSHFLFLSFSFYGGPKLMIQILEGVPGSGKTYYAVNYALKNYSEYDTFSRIYTLKENHIIITNIEGLKINHLSLEKVISDKQVEGFFSQENLKLLRTKYQKVLFIIDEAQAFFTKEVWSKI